MHLGSFQSSSYLHLQISLKIHLLTSSYLLLLISFTISSKRTFGHLSVFILAPFTYFFKNFVQLFWTCTSFSLNISWLLLWKFHHAVRLNIFQFLLEIFLPISWKCFSLSAFGHFSVFLLPPSAYFFKNFFVESICASFEYFSNFTCIPPAYFFINFFAESYLRIFGYVSVFTEYLLPISLEISSYIFRFYLESFCRFL